jgi:hypothetical protein
MGGPYPCAGAANRAELSPRRPSISGMGNLEDIGERDGWRCWLCDEPVDQQMSVNDSRGPSVDAGASGKESKRDSKSSRGKASSAGGGERLAHRGCNTRKGAVKAVVPWPARLFVADPAPLIGVAERLGRKGGREVVARCPNRVDAQETADWLIDRFSRLAPELQISTSIESGGGQFMVAIVGA